MKVCRLPVAVVAIAYMWKQNTKLLIDSGLSGKTITQSLDTIGTKGNDLDGILVTHDHNDHVCGVGYYLENMIFQFMLTLLLGKK